MTGPLKILIRHARRGPIPVGDDGSSALLTPQGHADAEAFGLTLERGQRYGIWSSPVERCLQTARDILKTAPDGSTGIVTEPYLSQGFIKDYEIARTDLLSRGYEPVLTDYVKTGEYPGFWPKEEGLTRMEEFIDARGGDDPALFITHDSIIIPLLSWRCGLSFSRSNWIGFLAGAIRTTEGVWTPFPC